MICRPDVLSVDVLSVLFLQKNSTKIVLFSKRKTHNFTIDFQVSTSLSHKT